MKKFIGFADSFEHLVVCPECNSVYRLKDCIRRQGVSELCRHQEFHKSRKCGASLLKTVELASGKNILYPIKVYCYQSIINSLKQLFIQPRFYELCEQWRSHPTSDMLSDIYDGRLWKDFQHANGHPFLASPGNLAFSLNVDWFQPYKLTQSSVGVLFLTILNLPRSVRYNRQYTILAGVIPGPNEPKRDINTFLDPLVKELTDLWRGVNMNVHSSSTLKNIRCALICVTCDIPTSRKVAGFLGHMATLGCSKCFKEFQGNVGSKNYSGFNRLLGTPRKNELHRSAIKSISQCSNKTEKQKMESHYGCKYSALLKLPYFDPICMVSLDPMHNLFLGTAKYVMKN